MKKILTKTLSVALIIFGLYHVVLSIVSIFYIYPHVMESPERYSPQLRQSLVEKAFIIYLSTIIDGIYGFSLLIKPSDEVKAIHLIAGFALFLFSALFVTKTQLTMDPILIILLNFFNFHP